MSIPTALLGLSGATNTRSAARPLSTSRSVPPARMAEGLWRSLEQAERALLDVPGPDAFQGYRQVVQQVIQTALSGAQVIDASGVSSRGRFRRMTLVVGIRQELETIRTSTLQQAPGMELLRHVDLLRGLLLDLFL